MTTLDRGLDDLATTPPVRPAETTKDLPTVDWRFLSSSLEFGTVALDPSVALNVRAAVQLCSTTIYDLDDPETPRCDTVVVGRPTRRRISRAVALMDSISTLRLESLPRLGRRRTLRQLRAAGLEAELWWARPGGPDPTCLVSLTDRRAAATVIRTVAGRGRWAIGEAWFARSGLARSWAGSVSVLARASVHGEAPHPAVASPDPTRRPAGLVTPRFAASRAVVGVTTKAKGTRLDRVAKVARRRADDEFVRDEAAVLSAFVARSTGASQVPGNHDLEERGGRSLLIEDAASGDPLDRPAVRRDPSAALRAGIAWLDQVPVGPRSQLLEDGRAADLLDQSLSAIERLPTDHRPQRNDHLGRADHLLQPLRQARLAHVFEHGDFSHPNLFMTSSGSMVAIDWERARPAGLPLHDLTFFVAYLAESVDRPATAAELVASYRRALRSGGWARAERDLHAEKLEIEPRLVRLLELACWTRALARLAERGRTPATSDGHRSELLWIASIHDAEDGRPR